MDSNKIFFYQPLNERLRFFSRLDFLFQIAQNTLHGIHGPIGNDLRKNEFLKTTLQRKNVPGGLSEYDPPIYQHWLMQPAEKRINDLTQWLNVFGVLRDAVKLILQLVRESASPVFKTAQSGLYQQNLDANISYQMVYVTQPVDTAYFAEISGGKHRFTVRFMDTTIQPRPIQTGNNVDFELYCCVL